jgi:hypothetical protein
VLPGWVLDTEEVVQDGPHVAVSVSRLALTDVENDYASRPAVGLWWLDREREPVVAFEVHAADHWLKRTRKPVSANVCGAGIPSELLMYDAIARPLAR